MNSSLSSGLKDCIFSFWLRQTTVFFTWKSKALTSWACFAVKLFLQVCLRRRAWNTCETGIDRLLPAQSPWCKGQDQVTRFMLKKFLGWILLCSVCCAGQAVLPAAPKILRRLRNIYHCRLSPLKYPPCSSEYPKRSLHLPKFIFSW